HGTMTPQSRFGLGGSGEGDAAAKRIMGTGAMTKLDQLNAERQRKFAEICTLLARQLGYGDFARIDLSYRKHIEREAEYQLSEWEETTELRTRAHIRPNTPLRRLLSDHQRICERILDEQDIEVGIWVYKKRGTRRRTLSL